MPKIVEMTITCRRLLKGYGLRSSMQALLASNEPFLNVSVQEDFIANGPVVALDMPRKEVQSFLDKDPKGNYIRIATWALVATPFVMYCPNDTDLVYDSNARTLSVNGAIINNVSDEPHYQIISKNHLASIKRCGITDHDARTFKHFYESYDNVRALLCQYGSSSVNKDKITGSNLVFILDEGKVEFNPNRYPKGMIMSASTETKKLNVEDNGSDGIDRDSLIEALFQAGHKKARLKKMDDAELVALHEDEFSEDSDEDEFQFPSTVKEQNKGSLRLKIEEQLFENSSYTQEELDKMDENELLEAYTEYCFGGDDDEEDEEDVSFNFDREGIVEELIGIGYAKKDLDLQTDQELMDIFDAEFDALPEEETTDADREEVSLAGTTIETLRLALAANNVSRAFLLKAGPDQLVKQAIALIDDLSVNVETPFLDEEEEKEHEVSREKMISFLLRKGYRLATLKRTSTEELEKIVSEFLDTDEDDDSWEDD